MRRHVLLKISPDPSLPSGPEALWAGGQRGGFLPLVSDPERSLTRRVKGGKEGFDPWCIYNYGLINSLEIQPAYIKLLIFDERSPSNYVEAVMDLVGDNPGPLAELWNLDKG